MVNKETATAIDDTVTSVYSGGGSSVIYNSLVWIKKTEYATDFTVHIKDGDGTYDHTFTTHDAFIETIHTPVISVSCTTSDVVGGGSAGDYDKARVDVGAGTLTLRSIDTTTGGEADVTTVITYSDADSNTIAKLVTKINAVTGWTAALLADTEQGAINSTEMDAGSYDCTDASQDLTALTGDDSENIDVGTDTIADELKTLLDASQAATTFNFTLTTTVVGSVMYLVATGDAPDEFEVTVSDGMGDEAMVVITDEINRFTQLPGSAKDEMIVKVVGNPDSERDDYYVKFVGEITGELGKGVWKETVAPGIKTTFDYDTVPHLLIRQSDDTFLFKAANGTTPSTHTGGGTTPHTGPTGAADPTPAGADYTDYKWAARAAGDTTTNADPSFIGYKISDINYFKNRLIFLSDENVILGESSEQFNFWRTTVSHLPESDPVDVASSHRQVSVLSHAMGFADKLILFSDQTQFVFSGATPRTATMAQVTDYEVLKDALPVSSGKSIFFGFKRGAFSGVREWFPTGDIDISFEGTDISSHVPKYIEGSIIKLTGSTHENLLVALTDTDPTSLYLYVYFDAGDQRVQSAWSKFTFGTGITILNVEFIEDTLYLIVKRTEGIFLEKMQLLSGLKDDDKDYITTLDRRIDEEFGDEGLARSHSTATDETTITLPYDVEAGSTIEVITKDGERLNVTSQAVGSPTITVRYKHDESELWIGEAYTMSYTFSEPLLKSTSTSTGNQQIIAQGRHQLRYGNLIFADTSYFKVTVTPDFGTTYNYVFNGRILGSGSATIGQLTLEDGEFKFPIFAQSSKITITVVNDSPLPSKINSAEWEGLWQSRSMRY